MDARQDDAELISQYIANRDPGSREAIILRYVPLVHYTLGRLGLSQSMGADYEDAVSQGFLGLIEAVDRFDPAFGAQFSTYAMLRVRGKVLDHLRSMDWLSRGARQRVRAVQQAISSLWCVLQRAPSDDELASHLKIDLPRLHRALTDSSRMMISLDSLVESDGDEATSLHELLPDEEHAGPAEAYEECDLKSRLVETLKALSEREQMVLSLYYHEELTFKEIGAVLEVSESRVCQLHGRAVMNLRALLRQPYPETGRPPPIPPPRRDEAMNNRSADFSLQPTAG